MENLQDYKSSLYCWIVLAVFIASTMYFMINFYNKVVEEISETALVNKNMIIEEIDD